MILHRLVEIKSRYRGGIEASKPHCTNENQLEWVRWIFEIVFVVVPGFVQLLHSLLVRFYRQPFLLKALLVTGIVADDNGHLDSFHPLLSVFQT